MADHTATLVADEPLGAGVRRLRLKLATPFANLLPGQYVGLHAPDGELVYFSVASIADDLPMVELHYAPMPGSPDVARMDALLAATGIRLTEPQGGTGLFAVPEAASVVLIAAATGISQAIAIVRGAAHANALTRIRLYWGVRDAAQLYARALLDDLAARLPSFEWIAVVSDDAAWAGRTGLVVDAALADGAAQAADLVILSGGPAMVQASAARLIDAGVERGRIRSDLL
jgi:CDP-4-dehydro-6-deoxyglucose reductase